MKIKEIIDKQRQQEEAALDKYEKVLREYGGVIVQAHKEYINELERIQQETKVAIQELMK